MNRMDEGLIRYVIIIKSYLNTIQAWIWNNGVNTPFNKTKQTFLFRIFLLTFFVMGNFPSPWTSYSMRTVLVLRLLYFLRLVVVLRRGAVRRDVDGASLLSWDWLLRPLDVVGWSLASCVRADLLTFLGCLNGWALAGIGRWMSSMSINRSLTSDR